MRRVVAIVAASIVVLVGAGVIALAASWEPRAFAIDEIAVDATVSPDGSMLVVEEVTYTFTGADDQPFSVASRSFEASTHPGRVVEIAAYEDGRPLDTVLFTPWLFEWDIYPARSGTRTFRLEYRVQDAVQVWSDTAELYWNWVGYTSPAITEWSATVQLPPGSGRVRAWAHGPLDGVVRISGDRVLTAVDDIPAGQFVDNRIIVPTDRFTTAPGDQAVLQAILDQEAANAAAADWARARADRDEQLRRTAARAVTAGVVPLVAAAAAAFYWVWRRWGKDPPRPTDVGDYWREVPDDPPAVGAALLRWRTVDSDAFSATVLDLARRGHLRIDEVEVPRLLRSARTDHRFTATSPSAPDPLTPYEQRTLGWMFAGNETTITQDELVERSKGSPTEANAFWTGFRSEVQADLDRRHYLAKGKGPAFALHFLVVAILVGFGIAGLAVGAVPAGILALVAAVVLLPLGILHRSRTPEGTRRDAKWRGLQRFLKDFSSLDEAPVGHLALWDQYLVAATALGVAEELLEALETRFPEVLESGSVATWYHPRASSGTGFRGIGSFGSSFGSPTVSAFSPPSSSSGGGGGFSSGGGGGGGGGGFGAR